MAKGEEDRKKILKIVYRIRFAFIVIAAAALAVLAFRQEAGKTAAGVDSPERFEEGWIYEGTNTGEAVFPFHVEEKGISKIILRNRLPEVLRGDRLILFRQYQKVSVYIDGQCVYRLEAPKRNGVETMVGTMIVTVPLSADDSGKQIEIVLEQVSSMMDIQVEGIYLCSDSRFLVSFLKSHAGQVFFVCIMLLIGILMLAAAWLGMRKRFFGYNFRMFLYLGVYILINTVWVAADSQLFQAVTGLHVTGGLLSFAAFMLLPVPLLAFINVICGKRSRLLDVLIIVHELNFLIQCLLYCIGVADLTNMLGVTHVLLVISVAAVTGVICYQVRRSRSYYLKGVLRAILVQAAAGILALIGFLLIPGFPYLALILTGSFLFIIILCGLCLHKAYDYLAEGKQAEIYQKLAYLDVMTQTGNRRAFEEEFSRYKKGKTDKDFTVFEFDLNNLKDTNDRFGHEAGDAIIIAAASCIKKVFNGIGKVYRTGGDEFVVLSSLSSQEREERLKTLRREVLDNNAREVYPFSIASGYASVREFPDDLPDELFQRADKRMYQNKYGIQEE